MERIMSINIPEGILDQIHLHGEKAYPEEGAGLMLGTEKNRERLVSNLLFLTNSQEDSARRNRFLITAEDMLRGEGEAERLGLSIIGVFHSHPDHPNQPSEFDREYAIPWYSYLITSIKSGKSSGSRCWRLEDDRERFLEENINILSK
jgi:proteasome lid subunit RPN8/RPN11